MQFGDEEEFLEWAVYFGTAIAFLTIAVLGAIRWLTNMMIPWAGFLCLPVGITGFFVFRRLACKSLERFENRVERHWDDVAHSRAQRYATDREWDLVRQVDTLRQELQQARRNVPRSSKRLMTVRAAVPLSSVSVAAQAAKASREGVKESGEMQESVEKKESEKSHFPTREVTSYDLEHLERLRHHADNGDIQAALLATHLAAQIARARRV